MKAARRVPVVVVILIGGLLWFPLTCIVTYFATRHWATAGAFALLSLAAVASLVWLRLTPRGRAMLAKDLATDWPGSVALLLASVALCTGAFATLSARLYESGVGTVKGGPLNGADIATAAYANYLWRFADTIPVVKVPKTLNWELRYPFTDRVNGALMLVYTVLVVLPFVYAAAEAIRRWTADPGPPPSDSNQ